jgi:hypothetical protein
MERKKALAAAGALTMVLGSAVVASAAVGGGSLLGFGGNRGHGPGSFTATEELAAATKPRVIHRTKNVYDKVVVAGTPATDGGTLGATTDASVAAPSVTAPTAPSASLPQPTTPPAVDDPPPATDSESVTTRPPGVPDDWPAGKPIPPMPPNCKQPQLEDNGVWNCQSSDD